MVRLHTGRTCLANMSLNFHGNDIEPEPRIVFFLVFF